MYKLNFKPVVEGFGRHDVKNIYSREGRRGREERRGVRRAREGERQERDRRERRREREIARQRDR